MLKAFDSLLFLKTVGTLCKMRVNLTEFKLLNEVGKLISDAIFLLGIQSIFWKESLEWKVQRNVS